MGRIVTNKYVSTNQITNRDFFEGINISSDSCMDLLDIARGRIIISNEPGHEAIFVLSKDGMKPIMVAQNPESEIPANILNYLNEKISEFETRVINSGDTIYNTLINYISEICGMTESRISEICGMTESRISEICGMTESRISEISGNVENRLSEFGEEMSDNFNDQNARIDALSSYTMNLKITDHFMLTEDEYFELSNEYGEKKLVLTNETSTYWLNGLKIGDVVYYNPDIYYCIYEDDGAHHEYPTPIISDGVFELTEGYSIEDEEDGAHTLVLGNVSISDHIVEILESGGGGGEDEDDTTISGHEMTIKYDILPDEHAIVIDGVELGDGNHTIILIESGGGDSEIEDNVFSDGTLDIEESSNSIVLNGNYSIENNTVTIN